MDAPVKYVVTVNDESRVVDVGGTDGRYRVAAGDDVWEVDARLTAQGVHSLLIDGVSYVADVTDRDGACVVEVGGEWYEITVEEQTRHIIRTRVGAAGAPRSGRSPRRFRVRSAASRWASGTPSGPATPWSSSRP